MSIGYSVPTSTVVVFLVVHFIQAEILLLGPVYNQYLNIPSRASELTVNLQPLLTGLQTLQDRLVDLKSLTEPSISLKKFEILSFFKNPQLFGVEALTGPPTDVLRNCRNSGGVLPTPESLTEFEAVRTTARKVIGDQTKR